MGVSLAWLLDEGERTGFAGACAAAGVAWTEPRTAAEWRERLATSARLSATPDAAQAVNGHWVIPALFGDGPGCFTTPFQLVHVKPVGELGKSITRDTKVKVAPVDAKGVAREELAVEATAGELCLRKTRELVYSYIGQGPVKGVTNERKETYVDYAARALAPAADANAIATDFVSHTWGDSFCDTVDALTPTDEELFHAFWQPPDFDYLPEDVGAFLRQFKYFAWPFVWLLPRSFYVAHFRHPGRTTPRALLALRSHKYFWVDILHKNQHIVNSEGTADELARCVQVCDRTALCCTPGPPDLPRAGLVPLRSAPHAARAVDPAAAASRRAAQRDAP